MFAPVLVNGTGLVRAAGLACPLVLPESAPGSGLSPSPAVDENGFERSIGDCRCAPAPISNPSLVSSSLPGYASAGHEKPPRGALSRLFVAGR